MVVSSSEQLHILMRAGYRCQVVEHHSRCPLRAGTVIRTPDAAVAVCTLHKTHHSPPP